MFQVLQHGSGRSCPYARVRADPAHPPREIQDSPFILVKSVSYQGFCLCPAQDRDGPSVFHGIPLCLAVGGPAHHLHRQVAFQETRQEGVGHGVFRQVYPVNLEEKGMYGLPVHVTQQFPQAPLGESPARHVHKCKMIVRKVQFLFQVPAGQLPFLCQFPEMVFPEPHVGGQPGGNVFQLLVGDAAVLSVGGIRSRKECIQPIQGYVQHPCQFIQRVDPAYMGPQDKLVQIVVLPGQ